MQRNKLVQTHFTVHELAQLNNLKQQMGVKSRPEVIREMLRDELLLAKLSEYRQAGTLTLHPVIWDIINEAPSRRRLELIASILGLDNKDSQETIQGASKRLNELKALLNAVTVQQQKTGTNINQIAKQLNLAAKGDTDNIDVWNWALKQLQSLSNTNMQLQQVLKKLENEIKVTNSRESDNGSC